MLNNHTAIVFHQNFCPSCHTVPKYEEWLGLNTSSQSLNVFHMAKRRGNWEPIYIGTNEDPPYDERLTWDGRKDKMTQAYIMCVLDYHFAILDNAFLIHKPGIKTRHANLKSTKSKKVSAQTKMIQTSIQSELNILYDEVHSKSDHGHCHL